MRGRPPFGSPSTPAARPRRTNRSRPSRSMSPQRSVSSSPSRRAGVEEQAEGLGVLAVLLLARLALALVDDLSGLAVRPVLARAGERLDLLHLVVVERRRRRLPALVGAEHRVLRKLEGVGATAVGENRSDHLAVLVHVARRQALAVERAQEPAHLDRRELVGRTIPERLHDPSGARAGAPRLNGCPGSRSRKR